jgi:hypothetical protein
VVGDDQEPRVGKTGHFVEEVAEPFDIGVVERRVHFVQHADWRGVGEEQGEDQRDGGEGLLAAGEQRQRLQALAGRLGENFETGFERVIGID